MVDDQMGHVVAERVGSFGKCVDGLHSAAAAVVRTEVSSGKKHAALSEELKEAASLEHYEALKIAFAALSDSVNELELHRSNVLVNRLDNTFQKKLADIKLLAVKPTKMLVEERVSALRSVSKAQSQFDIASTKGAKEATIEARREKLEDEEKRCKHVSEYLETNLLKYEERRVTDCVGLLNEYIKANIFFHCRAIEALTRASKTLHSVDSQEAVDNLRETLKQAKTSD